MYKKPKIIERYEKRMKERRYVIIFSLMLPLTMMLFYFANMDYISKLNIIFLILYLPLFFLIIASYFKIKKIMVKLLNNEKRFAKYDDSRPEKRKAYSQLYWFCSMIFIASVFLFAKSYKYLIFYVLWQNV